MKCPCENCLCVPVCKYKKYVQLGNDCSLFKDYLIKPRDPKIRPANRVRKVKEILQPTKWKYTFKNIRGESLLWILPEF